ncbi:multidrug transporter MATE [Pseudaestuariivita atlantica]|uniref:Multidrug transporter MATE n=2 Tax=Pseudaestuariivita atlantica TaxID=1317121 RepID=A0A0L1JTN8_9RHOB|nr:multidrug transporter MATE [Pseudaestuariivita atlantica]
MGHVVRMTLTGAAGITFVFVVDAANLFWIARLGDPALVAAIGYAFAIQFFSVSSGIGLMVGATALVSRAIGQGQAALAREQATATMIWAVAVQSGMAAMVVAFRHDLVALSGAEGEAAALAARYLALTVPSLGLMAVGLIGAAVLRAAGDGKRAMYVTLSGGVVAMVLDPVLIYGLGLGLDGAAMGLTVFRLVMCLTGLWFAVRVHDALARPSRAQLLAVAAPYAAISGPAILTQMSPPVANYLLTTIMAGFGDAAVAAWAVVNRLTVVAFGGIFALAGAIGGIFGQNFGAVRLDRVRQTYRDAVLFCIGYTLLVWAVLTGAFGPVARAFALDEAGRDILWAFVTVGAGSFVFAGALFVANAAFNTMGRPTRATAVAWARDGALTWPAGIALAGAFGAVGVIYAQAAVTVIAGIGAALWGWVFVSRLTPADAAQIDARPRRGYRDVNRYRRR